MNETRLIAMTESAARRYVSTWVITKNEKILLYGWQPSKVRRGSVTVGFIETNSNLFYLITWEIHTSSMTLLPYVLAEIFAAIVLIFKVFVSVSLFSSASNHFAHTLYSAALCQLKRSIAHCLPPPFLPDSIC